MPVEIPSARARAPRGARGRAARGSAARRRRRAPAQCNVSCHRSYMASEPEPAVTEDEVSPFTGTLTPDLAADTAWCTQHATQLRSIGLPASLAQTLASKLRLQQFDAGASITFGWTDGFRTARDSWFVAAQRDIAAGSDVWLSDHVWLLEGPMTARAQIASTPELASRLWMLLGTAEEGDPPPDPDSLLSLIAPLAHPIKFASSDGSSTSQMHYVADEFGSRITLVPVGNESNRPNVGFAAIFDELSQRTYSVVWPCEDIAEGEELRRLATPSLALIAEGGESYWKRRFDAEEKFDWYCGWDAIEEVVMTILETVPLDDGLSEKNVLVTGNGNSPLPLQLEQSAKTSERGVIDLRIVAVDYVASVVERMRATYPPDQTTVAWVVGDVTDWSSFDCDFEGEQTFHLIIDKGCLDAFLVKPVAERERPEDTWVTDINSPHISGALAYLDSCSKALEPTKGKLLLVTLGRREYREPLLAKAGLKVRPRTIHCKTAGKGFVHVECGPQFRCGSFESSLVPLSHNCCTILKVSLIC